MCLICAVISATVHAKQVNITAPATAVVCAACHGEHGQSPREDWPNLAGQHAEYILKQLHAFRAGKKRFSAVMQPMISGLSEQTMLELAVFYSQQPLALVKQSTANIHGREIYLHGDRTHGIPACIACHGPTGQGNAPAGFPVLSGQKKDYTIMQLLAFQQKTRRNDLRGIMQDIAANMTTEDINDVAIYLAGLKVKTENKE